MNLWIDDCRPAPQGYIWCNTVNESKILIEGATETIKKYIEYRKTV